MNNLNDLYVEARKIINAVASESGDVDYLGAADWRNLRQRADDLRTQFCNAERELGLQTGIGSEFIADPLYDIETGRITNWLVEQAVCGQFDAFFLPGLEHHHSGYNDENVMLPPDPSGLFWDVKDSAGDLKIVVDALDKAGLGYEVFWDPRESHRNWLIWVPELPKINK